MFGIWKVRKVVSEIGVWGVVGSVGGEFRGSGWQGIWGFVGYRESFGLRWWEVGFVDMFENTFEVYQKFQLQRNVQSVVGVQSFL